MAIVLLSLGPGPWTALTLEAQELLAGASALYVRTMHHPVIARLKGSRPNLRVEAVEGRSVEELAERILARAREVETIYAAAGNALDDDGVARLLHARAHAEGLPVRAIAGLGLRELARAIDGTGMRPELVSLDALELTAGAPMRLDASKATLVTNVASPRIAQGLLDQLRALYPGPHEVCLFVPRPAEDAPQPTWLRLDEASAASVEGATCIYIPALGPEQLPGRFESLVHIVARLRAPDGCPWDREQTHESLKDALLEECYEALQALDRNDLRALQEELGDLLLHVLFHAQIAAEAGEFTLEDILRTLHHKMIRRHPHVFGTATARTAEEVLQQWHALKQEERAERGDSLLASVPIALPALAYSQAVQERVQRVGFKWPDVQRPIEKLAEEVKELVEAKENAERTVEFGDLLFNIVNIALHLGISAEEALRRANEKFVRRFTALEQLALERGRALQEMTLTEMLALWDEVKSREARGET